MGFFSKLFGSSSSEKTENSDLANKLDFLEVDIHNHLLPGIDDGSASVEESVKYIDRLQYLGLNKFICTPHIMKDVHPNTRETIDSAYHKLNTELQSKGKKVEIFAAAEHMIDDGLDSLVNTDSLCVMPGGYVLIEMSYLAESKALFQTILDIRNKGYKPILAHPERYNYYHMNNDIFKQIKSAGCYLQLNLLSMSRYYGDAVKAAATNLLHDGMYDFVGTDLHHEKHLNAIESVVQKYPIREMLKKCDIKNQQLLDYLK